MQIYNIQPVQIYQHSQKYPKKEINFKAGNGYEIDSMPQVSQSDLRTTYETISKLFGQSAAMGFLAKVNEQNRNIAAPSRVMTNLRTQGNNNIVKYTREDVENYADSFDYYDEFPPQYKGKDGDAHSFAERMWAYKIPFDKEWADRDDYDRSIKSYWRESGHIVTGEPVDISRYDGGYSELRQWQHEIKDSPDRANVYNKGLREGVFAEEQYPINQHGHYCIPIERKYLPESLRNRNAEFYIDMLTGDISQLQDFYFIKK